MTTNPNKVKRRTLEKCLQEDGFQSVIGRTFRNVYSPSPGENAHGPAENSPYIIKNIRLAEEKETEISRIVVDIIITDPKGNFKTSKSLGYLLNNWEFYKTDSWFEMLKF